VRALLRRSSEPGDVALAEIPEPTPGPGQVKIRVQYAGICGSDLKFLEAHLPTGSKIRPPVVLGHEGWGIVTETGEEVTNLRIGDRVAAETTLTACGMCRYCRTGRLSMCPTREGLGSRANGYFAEYLIARASGCHKIPDNMSDRAAALLEPLACAVNAVLQVCSVRPGEVAVVFGPGTIGLCVAQLLKLSGAYVIMVGTSHGKRRLEVARRLGVDRVLIADEQDVVGEIVDLTNNYGADIAYECVGSGKAFEDALHSLRKLGRLVVAASPLSEIKFDARSFHTKQINMIGAASTDPSSWDITMNLVRQGLVHLEDLVTDVFPLDQWQAAIEKAKAREGIKVLLKP